MKLIYIANARIPTEKAHGIQIIKMCEAFANADVNVDLILPTRKNNDFKDADVYTYYNVKNNFTITKIKTPDPTFLFKFPSGTYIKIQTLLFIKSLNRYLRQQKLKDTILYTRDQYLLPLLFKFSDKVVWEAHDLPGKKERYVSFWSSCYKIITITKSLKADLITLGVDENKILTAPDGVDLNQFSQAKGSREELGLPLNKKLILYSGHLFDWKGAHILAKAADFFSDDFQIAFLGGTDEEIKKFKEEYQKKNIKVIGRVRQDEVPKYLSVADVLVLPNSANKKISTNYTSPLKLFEYLASGRPIVASALPSIKEILNANNSILVEPDNPHTLATGIKKILEDKELGKKISGQALEDVKQYSWDKRVKNILDFICN